MRRRGFLARLAALFAAPALPAVAASAAPAAASAVVLRDGWVLTGRDMAEIARLDR